MTILNNATSSQAFSRRCSLSIDQLHAPTDKQILPQLKLLIITGKLPSLCSLLVDKPIEVQRAVLEEMGILEITPSDRAKNAFLLCSKKYELDSDEVALFQRSVEFIAKKRGLHSYSDDIVMEFIRPFTALLLFSSHLEIEISHLYHTPTIINNSKKVRIDLQYLISGKLKETFTELNNLSGKDDNISLLLPLYIKSSDKGYIAPDDFLTLDYSMECEFLEPLDNALIIALSEDRITNPSVYRKNIKDLWFTYKLSYFEYQAMRDRDRMIADIITL